jgi:hypothetical protein
MSKEILERMIKTIANDYGMKVEEKISVITVKKQSMQEYILHYMGPGLRLTR